MNVSSKFDATTERDKGWYELFSRGARDWLRHNEKVRDAVRENLSDIVSQANIADSDGQRRVQLPVKFLEHYRFRLGDVNSHEDVGQGPAEPGDLLRPADAGKQQPGSSEGGNERGAVEFVLELTVDDIVDWLWEELELPNLVRTTGEIDQDDYMREGWDRRGVRSRLDRRRSLKESIKRRSIQQDGPAITDGDLRFRQLVQREQPTCKAVVFFVMDVSASMTTRDRQLAKTFFFWVVQGLRRQYQYLDCEFIAHTDLAWRFSEEEFFRVKGSGGTVASCAFDLVNQTVNTHFDPNSYNIYFFYASDGDNFGGDHAAAERSLRNTMAFANFGGLAQISSRSKPDEDTEMAEIFASLETDALPLSSYFLHSEEEVWDAIKAFFRRSVESLAV